MNGIAAIGSEHDLVGFTLAGVDVRRATTDREIDDAWVALGPDIALVILTAAAAARLRAVLPTRPDLLSVVLP